MKLDPETREKAAEAARTANYRGATKWGELSEQVRGVWQDIADAVAATIPEPTPAESPQPTRTLPTVDEIADVLRDNEDGFRTDAARDMLSLFAAKAPWRFPDSWERGHEAKYWIETGLTPYGLTLDADHAPGVLNWLGVNYYTPDSPYLPAPQGPTPAPQPIDLADVRKGDRVRVVTEGVVSEVHHPGEFYMRQDDGETTLGIDPTEPGTTLYLLDRPDPRLALVLECLDESEPETREDDARTLLALLDELGTRTGADRA